MSNPQAFPCFERGSAGAGHLDLTDPGMTLRDYFAAHAPEVPGSFLRLIVGENGLEDDISWVVRWRMEYADAMLKAREVQP